MSEELFWDTTPRRFYMYLDAYAENQDRKGAMLAHFTAALLNAWSKKPVKAKDLYRTRKSSQDFEETKVHGRERFDEAVARMGPQAIPVRDRNKKVGE